MNRRPISLVVMACTTFALTACAGRDGAAVGDCSPGITDTEVHIGSSLPLSGAGAAYGAIAVATKAYFDEINESGGVKMADGKTRKIKLTTLDDAYDPARTVANARTLVEKDKVAATMNVLGTSPNLAITDYIAGVEIPNLFAMTGTDDFSSQGGERQWMQAFLPQYAFEAQVLGEHVIEEKPDAKVGILYQNDGFGKGMLANFKEVFDGTGVEIVSEQSYEQTGGSVDSQMVNLAKSGADVFLDYATGTFMTQSVKKKKELGWEPLTILTSGSTHAESLLNPAGKGAADGAISMAWLKDVSDPSWADDEGMKAWNEFAKRNSKEVDAKDSAAANGYTTAQLTEALLEATDGCKSGDILDSATSLKGVGADLFLPGLTANTSPDYPYVLSSVKLEEFSDSTWHIDDAVIDRKK